MKKQEKIIISVSLGVFLLVVIVLQLIPYIASSIEEKNSDFIGLVVETKNDAKLRFGDSVSWKKAEKMDRLYSKSYLFTGDDSFMSYALLDGSKISLSSNSLVFLDYSATDLKKDSTDAPLDIELLNGNVGVNIKEKSKLKKIKVDNTVIDFTDKKTHISLTRSEDKSVEIVVMQGDVNIVKDNKNFQIDSGEKLSISADEKASPEESKVDESTLDEMKRIAAQENWESLEELQKKRNFKFYLEKTLRFFNLN